MSVHPRGQRILQVDLIGVLQLRRALHGLRQAPRAWSERLASELREKGFVQSRQVHPCGFSMQRKDLCWLFFWSLD
jgi:hypothetical protein